jgi:AAA domain
MDNQKERRPGEGAAPDTTNEKEQFNSTAIDAHNRKKVIEQNIPDVLKVQGGWLVHNKDKVPFQSKNPAAGASINNVDHWSGFEAALKTFQTHKNVSGVGVVMTSFTLDVIGIDLDRCIDDAGNIADWAQAIVDSISSYWEVSPSGKGLRCFCYGTLPGKCFTNNKLNVELYDSTSPRYLTVTGHHLPRTSKTLASVDVTELYNQYKTGTDTKSVETPMPELLSDGDVLSTEELVSKHPSEFDELLNGFDPSTDRSEVLAKLTNTLYSYGFNDAEVLTLLAGSCAMDVAKEKRNRKHNNAMTYLWIHQCLKSRCRGREDEFDDISGDDDIKPNAGEPTSWLGVYSVSDKELAEMADPEWLVVNMVIRGHLIVFCAEPNAGKTAILMHISAQIVSDFPGTNVYYINADVSGNDAGYYQDLANAGGFNLYLPDMIIGKSMANVVIDLERMVKTTGPAGLNKHVFIFDTLKKMTDVINKAQAKKLYSILRSMTSLGATVICLAHTNKYKDAEGRPVYEGTGDLRSDFDELIYFIPITNPDGSKTVSTDIDKQRGTFKKVTFHLGDDRSVRQDAEYVDTSAERIRITKRNRDIEEVNAIRLILSDGPLIQGEICSKLNAVLGTNNKATKRILHTYCDGIAPDWTSSRGENNSLVYTLAEDTFLSGASE